MPILSRITTLEQLARVLATQRANKKIVLCHGVFDLLHIGHIRYFEEAKTRGDLLVVTVTPDRFVNKGPNRPAFNEQLRVEAVSALSCVDFVALNQSPTAIEAICMLRPHYYVKGPDYKNLEKDYTGGIQQEKATIESIGGELVFTNDITFSSTNLINRFLSPLSPEVGAYLSDFSSRFPMQNIFHQLEEIRTLRVAVIGETIIDEYQYCEAIGKSAKEPMLALKRLSTEKFAGGVLAVANHLANFCEEVDLISFLGAENDQYPFIEKSLNPKIHKRFLYQTDSPTILKRRLIDHYSFAKLLEVYEINDQHWDPENQNQLCATLDQNLSKYDVVICIDYGHGMLGQEALNILAKKSKFLVVNTQSNAGNLGFNTISKYPRADLICLDENEVKLEARDRSPDLKSVILRLAEKMDCGRVIITRGKYGCLCYSRTEGFFTVPALALQVVDRMGAGDAFLSLVALCAANEAPMEMLGFIGNVLGAEAVKTVGHKESIRKTMLFKHIETLLK